MTADYDIEALRHQFATTGTDIVASPSLGARAAAAGRKRRVRRRIVGLSLGAAAAVALTTVATGAGDRPSPTGPGTAVVQCPTSMPPAVNPGLAKDKPMLPAKPGDMLLCTYTATSDGSGNSVDYLNAGSRRLSGADAVALAASIHDAPVLTQPRRCPMEQTIRLLFFRNTAGHEAIAEIGGCTGTWDGTRLVDPHLPELALSAPSSAPDRLS